MFVEGLISARVGFAAFESRAAALTLLSGWIVGATGLLAWLRSPASRVGPILVAVSIAWFAGALQGASIEVVSVFGDRVQLLYAAILAHAILTYPDGRAARRSIGVLIALGYLAALVPSPFASALVGMVLAAGLVLRRVTSWPNARSRRWPDLVPWIAGVPVAAVLVSTPFVAGVLPGGSAFDVRPIIQIVVVIAATGLAAGAIRIQDGRAQVTDLLIDLGSGGTGVDRALAIAVGDPTLRVGYWVSREARYFDATGQPVELPLGADDRRVTFVDRGRDRIAVLVHDVGVGADPWIRAAITRAAELAAVNAGMRTQTQAQIEEIRASRRRLLEAADAERRLLQGQIRETLDPDLAALEHAVADPGLRDGGPDPALDGSLDHLHDVRRDLAQLADGLRPSLLEHRGLAGALAELAGRCAVPVEVDVDADAVVSIAPAAQTALFFVSSEALTNVTRHADATWARLRLTGRPGIVELEISDDGRGGADPGRGTGLQGLRDRIDAIGGQLVVESPIGSGTRLAVRLPLDDAHLGS